MVEGSVPGTRHTETGAWWNSGYNLDLGACSADLDLPVRTSFDSGTAVVQRNSAAVQTDLGQHAGNLPASASGGHLSWCHSVWSTGRTSSVAVAASSADSATSLVDSAASADSATSSADFVTSLVDSATSVDFATSSADSATSSVDSATSLVDSVTSLIDSVTSWVDFVTSFADSETSLVVVVGWGNHPAAACCSFDGSTCQMGFD